MKKTLKYIFISILLTGIFFVGTSFAFVPADIVPVGSSQTIGDTSATETMNLFDQILTFIKDSIFGLLGLVAIGMFLYVGFSLIKAQGNPEELKKAFMTLIHVIIGLFIIAISWAIIKMVSGLTF